MNAEDNRLMDQLRAVLSETETEGARLIPQQSEGLTDEQVLVLALLTHSFRAYRGIRILLNEGLAHEASVLNRALLEATTRLAYFMQHKDKLEELRLRLLHDSLLELERLAQFETALSMPEAGQAVAETQRQRQDLDQAFARLNLKPGGLPGPRQMLAQLGKEERYWYFKRASADVHGSVVSLGTKMTAQGEGRFVAALQDDQKTALVIGMAAADHFMSALIAAGALLEWESQGELRVYRRRIDDQLLDLARKAELRGLPQA